MAAEDQLLQQRQHLLPLLKQNLETAQARIKAQANQHKTDMSFSVGDWVYLKLQPYRQLSLRSSHFHKLSPRYYGPFQILQRIGQVAYKLDLPVGCSIHSVFPISCLKLKLGSNVVPFLLFHRLILMGCSILKLLLSCKLDLSS